jgi:hypothetical protein
LFQKWGGGPLHVVLEEAHEFAPQMAGSRSQNTDNESAMLGAFKRLWKLGRASGIGGTAVTQRPASLSKDITTQSEILIAHRTIGPQDVKAIGEWVKYHGERLDILAELPSLPTGEAFVWAPEFPEGQPIGLQRTSILLRETYDSASTPKVGEQRVEPKELAAVDLERLRVKMAATIEKAKADDPRELRKTIAELKKQLALKSSPVSEKVTAPVGKPVPVLTDADRALLGKLADHIANLSGALDLDVSKLIEDVRVKVASAVNVATSDMLTILRRTDEEAEERLRRVGFQKILGKLSHITPPEASAVPRSPLARRVDPAPSTSRPARQVSASNGNGNADLTLGKCERSILIVLAQNPDGCTSGRLTLLTRYRYSGGFKNSLSALRQAGLMAGENTGTMQITDAGATAIGDVDALPTGDALAQYWLTHQSFGKCERAILEALLTHPKGLTADQLCEATAYQYSGGFKNSLASLRTAGVVVGRNTDVMRASEELFS